MREICLDTETTGLDPRAGHRIVEIGCVELVHRIPTNSRLQLYINPMRDMPEDAFRVHGLSEQFLRNHPVFEEIVDKFLDFIGDSPVIAHNAEFDMNFLNWELGQIGREPIEKSRVIDTLILARKKFPGAQASLDALCKRFDIDNSGRNLHGALLDAQLLADVYLELTGGRQVTLGLGENAILVEEKGVLENIILQQATSSQIRTPRPHVPTEEERTAHSAFIAGIQGAIWGKD